MEKLKGKDLLINGTKLNLEYYIAECSSPEEYISEVISSLAFLNIIGMKDEAYEYEDRYFGSVATKSDSTESLYTVREALNEYHITLKDELNIEPKHHHLIDDSFPEILAKFYYDYDYYEYKDAFDTDTEAYQSIADVLISDNPEEMEEIYSYIKEAAENLGETLELDREFEANMIYALLKGRDAVLAKNKDLDNPIERQRYIAVMGFNTKQWWVYDEETGNYIDPPSFVLNEVNNSSQDVNSQEEFFNRILSNEPDWVNDKDYIYEDEDFEI